MGPPGIQTKLWLKLLEITPWDLPVFKIYFHWNVMGPPGIRLNANLIEQVKTTRKTKQTWCFIHPIRRFFVCFLHILTCLSDLDNPQFDRYSSYNLSFLFENEKLMSFQTCHTTECRDLMVSVTDSNVPNFSYNCAASLCWEQGAGFFVWIRKVMSFHLCHATECRHGFLHRF